MFAYIMRVHSCTCTSNCSGSVRLMRRENYCDESHGSVSWYCCCCSCSSSSSSNKRKRSLVRSRPGVVYCCNNSTATTTRGIKTTSTKRTRTTTRRTTFISTITRTSMHSLQQLQQLVIVIMSCTLTKLWLCFGAYNTTTTTATTTTNNNNRISIITSSLSLVLLTVLLLLQPVDGQHPLRHTSSSSSVSSSVTLQEEEFQMHNIRISQQQHQQHQQLNTNHNGGPSNVASSSSSSSDSTFTVVDNASVKQQQQQQQQKHSPIVTLKKISSLFYNTAPIPMYNNIKIITEPNHEQQKEYISNQNNNNNNNKDRIQHSLPLQEQQQQQELSHDEIAFLQWCHNTYNISTNMIQIQYFPYNKSSSFPFMMNNKIDNSNNNNDDDVDDWTLEDRNDINKNNSDDDTTNNIIWIRGLAASRDIKIGEIILRIPNQALFTIHSLIDIDPILSSIIGPISRIKYGWNVMYPNNNTYNNTDNEDDDNNTGTTDHMYEIPLLAIALLYHRQLGSESPIYEYIKILVHSPMDHLPYTWNHQQQFQYYKRTFSKKPTIPVSINNVLTIANEIRHEIQYMYKHVVLNLVAEHPTIFGNTTAMDPITKQWIYSYTMFQWAYAIVNSRHWQLPYDVLANTTSLNRNNQTTTTLIVQKPSELQQQQQHSSVSSPILDEGLDQLPPADTPTESWVSEHRDLDEEINNNNSNVDSSKRNIDDNSNGDNMELIINHSFLAPLADLLNFGPPCTRVRYNETTNTFDTVATCNIEKGQEITFWYSNECSDIMMSLYGFAHPLISHCLSNEELQYRNMILETKIHNAQKNLKLLEDELEYIENILDNCDCCFNNTLLLLEDDTTIDHDPTISTMLLHEQEDNRNYVGSGLRQTHSGDEQQHQHDQHQHDQQHDSVQKENNNHHPPMMVVSSDTNSGSAGSDVIVNDNNDVTNNHLLIRRTDTSKQSRRRQQRRRWSQTSEF